MSQLLGPGDAGDEVVLLQRALAALGYAVESSETFDDATVQALLAFQLDNGLSQSGVYDDETYHAMAAPPVFATPASADGGAAGEPLTDAAGWVGTGDAADLRV